MVGEPELEGAQLRARAERAVEGAARRLRQTRAGWPPERPAPVHTRGGRWYRPAELWTDWTPGFYAGQMWILARLTGEEEWRRAAEAHTVPLKPRRFDREVHDLGFIFLPTYRRWRDLLPAGDPRREELEETLVTAATVQSFRWRERPGGEDGFIYSFNGPQSLFIDTLMTVRLLFWAERHGGSSELARRARAHVRTSLRYLVRHDGPGLGEEDGSVAHEAIFNAAEGRGEFRSLSTQQGYSPFTTWSRGLAWAIYGLAEAHLATRAPEFLQAAERCAAFYRSRTPADGVPYWDYGAPGIPEEPRDSSAAAIAASGLLRLAEGQELEAGRSAAGPKTARASEGTAAEGSRRAARRILESLTSERYSSEGRSGEEGLLLHATYHRPRGWGVDGSVLWGDYFFLEGLEMLLRGPDQRESG